MKVANQLVALTDLMESEPDRARIELKAAIKDLLKKLLDRYRERSLQLGVRLISNDTPESSRLVCGPARKRVS